MIQKRVFCEVAMKNNPGPGSWSYVAYEGATRLFGNFGKFDNETSNRAKMLAVLGAMEAMIKLGENIEEYEFFTNYKVLVDAIDMGWLDKWQRNGWKATNGKPIDNVDLWKKVIEYRKNYSIQIKWGNKKSSRFKLPRKLSRKVYRDRERFS